ncbi:MAG: guanylate kinase [Bacillota bacterium]
MVPLVKNGMLVVLSGPSGVGKGTVCSFLRQQCPDLFFSISATTREARLGEVDGKNYYFLPREEFLRRKDNDEFLEWAEVYGNYYGTPRLEVEKNLSQGKDVILEIDIQGAMKVKEKFPDGVFIFLLPPSRSELKKRILGRGADTKTNIEKRLSCVDKELAAVKNYDYAVLNAQVEEAVAQILCIIRAEKCRIFRNCIYSNF